MIVKGLEVIVVPKPVVADIGYSFRGRWRLAAQPAPKQCNSLYFKVVSPGSKNGFECFATQPLVHDTRLGGPGILGSRTLLVPASQVWRNSPASDGAHYTSGPAGTAMWQARSRAMRSISQPASSKTSAKPLTHGAPLRA